MIPSQRHMYMHRPSPHPRCDNGGRSRHGGRYPGCCSYARARSCRARKNGRKRNAVFSSALGARRCPPGKEGGGSRARPPTCADARHLRKLGAVVRGGVPLQAAPCHRSGTGISPSFPLVFPARSTIRSFSRNPKRRCRCRLRCSSRSACLGRGVGRSWWGKRPEYGHSAYFQIATATTTTTRHPRTIATISRAAAAAAAEER